MVITTASRPAGETATSSGLAMLQGMPRQGWRRLREAATTTPGRLFGSMIGLIVLSLLFGLVGAVMVEQKQSTLDDLANRREPVATASQEIYRSLSDADATAASVLLSVDADPTMLRGRYRTDIAQAGSALAVAATNSDAGAVVGDPINVLTAQLPIYTGLIESANANNRQGFPVGAAYLREASGLMRTKLLPAAERLYLADNQRLNDQQDDATSFPWFTTLVLLALIAALGYVQRYLRQRTNRVFNVGLVVASAAVVLALLWGSTALVISAIRAGEGRSEGSQPVQALADARIAAAKARADETLALVARNDDTYTKGFYRVAGFFGGKDGTGGLMSVVRERAGRDAGIPQGDDAVGNAKRWLAAHDEVRGLLDAGRYDKAVKATVGSGPQGAGTAYYKLDDNLQAGIDSGRKTFVHGTTAGANALLGLSGGLVVLALIAAAGATVGVSQRLQEYR
ncbi:MAG: hypothetical protein ACRDQ5_03185 [Sciscionella sp.]